MRYKIEEYDHTLRVEVEASFSLLDFLALFSCLVFGVYLAVLLWIFAAAVLVRLFTKNVFEFNFEEQKAVQYLKIVSYLKIKRYTIPFNHILVILFSNLDSGPALFEFGTKEKEWYSLEIKMKEKNYLIVKGERDEFDQLLQLYFDMESRLDDEIFFQSEFIEFEDN